MSDSNENDQGSKSDYEFEKITWGEIIRLEKAAENGDADAQQQLEKIHELESYKELQRIIQAGAQSFTDQFRVSEDLLRGVMIDKDLFTQKWIDLADANMFAFAQEQLKSKIPDQTSLAISTIGMMSGSDKSALEKEISEIAKAGKSTLQDLVGLSRTTKSALQAAMDAAAGNPGSMIPGMHVSEPFLIPLHFSSQERLARDIAENTWSNRQLRDELRKRRSGGPDDKPNLPSNSELVKRVIVAFDILDAATEYCLSNQALGIFEFRRKLVTSGSVAYYLYGRPLGYLGNVTLRKTEEKKSAIEIYGPPRPDDQEVIDYYYHDFGWRVEGGSYYIHKGDNLELIQESELVPLVQELQEKKRLFLLNVLVPKYFELLYQADIWSGGSADKMDISSEQISSDIKPEKTARKAILDQACIDWVNRGFLGRYSREEFLQDFENRTGEYISLDEFKRALRDAHQRDIIRKERGRFKAKITP